jgi:phenylacetate-CoA ligase
VVRLHASSGTTGKPTVVFYTRGDLDIWSDMIARCMAMVGVVPDDVFQNIVGYGLFTGGLGFHYGAEKLGVLTVPSATGRTTLQIDLMQDFNVTAVHSTPSYALHLAEVARANGVDPVEDLDLRIGMFGAEFWSDNTRPRLEAALGVDAFDSYGLSEMYGPGVAFECEERKGLHVWEDIFLVEVIDPKTGEQVGEGEKGELVLTTLVREAMPLLRYRTGDITRVLSSETCDCGRTHLRLEKFLGRTDDMLKIRGVNVFPSQIEHILMEIPELSENYQIELETRGLMDEITVVSEIGKKAFTGDVTDLIDLRQRVESIFSSKIGLRIKVKFVEPGSIERSTGKAKRIIDKRMEG